jgi:hypothetical protein
MVLFLFSLASADEILLTNGKILTNIKIIQNIETEETITVLTSKQNEMVINKSEISAIKLSEFDKQKESKIIKKTLTEYELLDFQRLNKNEDEDDYEYKTINGKEYKVLKKKSFVSTLPVARIGLGLGYSYREINTSGNLSEEYSDYISDMRNGFNINADFSNYIFNEYIGYILKVNRFSSSSSIAKESFNNKLVDISEDIVITYWGLGLSSRIVSMDKIIIIPDVSYGIITYNNNAMLDNTEYNLKGHSFTFSIGLAADYIISNNITVGGYVSFISGRLETFYVDNIEVGANENLHHFNFNISFHYNFPQKQKKE